MINVLQIHVDPNN